MRTELVADVEHHTPEEFGAALESLDDRSLGRLKKVMRLFQRPPLMGGQDLLQEAVVRTLSGDRNWPLKVDVVKFLVETMRSIADEAGDRVSRESGLSSVATMSSRPGDVVGIVNRTGRMLPVQGQMTPEEALVTVQEAGQIKAWRQQAIDFFEGDFEAQLMVEGMLEGLKGKDLQAATGLDGTAFESKQRLVRRGFEKLGDEAMAGRRRA